MYMFGSDRSPRSHDVERVFVWDILTRKTLNRID